MFSYQLSSQKKELDFLLAFLCMNYLAMVIMSIMLFNQILTFHILDKNLTISGSVIPYVFLYPISFIVLKIYGFKQVNQMIGAMLVSALVFIVMAKIILVFSSNPTSVHTIINSAFKMYLAGFIGMPAGIYASFLVISFLDKIGISFNILTIALATIVGEIVNTVIVFPIGFHGKYAMSVIFSTIIVDTLIMKLIIGVILSCFAIIVINLMIDKKIHSV